MRLASLTVQGFKSFGNRVSVEFAPGVTAIIGPNGSGKSNLVDALKWTTGGGRAREFRAADKTDLIFHGASGKRSVGLAEVEVELAQRDRSFKLYRSLSRDGTTRLRLNGRAARFLDLEEALAGSGLGRAGLSIIGQGEVSQVLMADPPKLLEYVAEVAGVARMSARREQTLARLETAMSHLDRLQDLVLELDARCSDLASEAADAEKHAELSALALRLLFTASSARVEALRKELEGLHERQAALETALAEGRERQRDSNAQLQQARAAHGAAEVRYREALAETELRKGDLRVAEGRARHATERRDATAATLRTVRAEAERIERLDAPHPPERQVQPLLDREAELEASRASCEAELGAATEDVRTGQQRLEALREARLRAERDRAGHEERVASLKQQAKDVEARLARLAAEAVPPEDAEADANLERRRLEDEQAERALELARSELAAAHAKHAGHEAESRARGRAVERLRAALDSRRGYAQGPRNALTSGISGVIGSVADLLRVAPEHERAIAAALGRRAEYVVVDSADTGRDVIRYVRSKGGYVTVLPLDLLRPGRGRGASDRLDEAGVVGAAVDLVRTDEAYRLVAEQMLGGTLIMASLDAATALARKAAARPRMVTLEGDILEASGAMSGGQRSQHASVLGAAAELEEAEQLASDAAAKATAAFTALQAAQDVIRAAQARAGAARAELGRARERVASARERASARSSLHAELTERRDVLARARAALRAPEASFDEGLRTEAEASQLAAAARLERLRSDLKDVLDDLSAVRQARLVTQERWRSYHADKARLDEERARGVELRTESGRLERTLEEAEQEVEAATAAIASAEAALPTGLDRALQAVEGALARATEIERAITRETEAQAGRAQQLEDVRVQRGRRETALELAEEERAALPSGVEALELSERAARQRLRETNEALEALGAVNHRASKDLQEVRERKETLEVESVQAALAVTELNGTLERIDRETTERLGDALARMQDGFATHVRQLFGDEGSGAIEVDEEDGRPTGIRIRLRPPGKQTHSLHLLSVGERTMGALAFLFALMADGSAGGGLPIAVLDEVDAPLDEANIRRYGGFVQRLAASGTQFVLITHQKATFEVADMLWGVTTEQGVSRVFSIRREEAAAVP